MLAAESPALRRPRAIGGLGAEAQRGMMRPNAMPRRRFLPDGSPRLDCKVPSGLPTVTGVPVSVIRFVGFALLHLLFSLGPPPANWIPESNWALAVAGFNAIV
jgi:hypothetical protein